VISSVAPGLAMTFTGIGLGIMILVFIRNPAILRDIARRDRRLRAALHLPLIPTDAHIAGVRRIGVGVAIVAFMFSAFGIAVLIRG
jgi:hypothetical protein